MMMRLSFLILFLIISTYERLMATDYEYTVSGKVQSQYGAELDFGRGPSTFDFTVNVTGSRWLIRLVPKHIPQHPHSPPEAKTAAIDYLEASSDGATFYYVISTASTKQSDPKIINSGEGFRGPGRVPYGSCDDEIICLWYVYASQNYFEGLEGTLIYPLQSMPLDRCKGKEFLQPAEWVISQSLPKLPSTINVKATWQGTDGNNSAPQSFTNVVLSVTSFTNTEGIVLPSSADVSFYYCFPPPRPFQTFLRKRIAISAMDVTGKVRECSFVPALPFPSVVTEMRFLTSKAPAVVSLLSKEWPDDRKVLGLYKERIQFDASRGRTVSRHRILVQCILLGMALVPVLFLTIRRIRNQRTR